jgi:phosphoesterase RecJ-like protein
VLCLNADPAPRNLDWLAEEQPSGMVQTYEAGNLEQAQAVASADVLLVVDTNSEKRLGDVAKVFRQAGKPIVLLDHHPDPESWFTVSHVQTDAAAAAEIAYDLIVGIDPDLIDRAVATALYVGIMTDTGSFRYSATTPKTHAVVADILERGDLKAEPIHISLFDGKSREGLALLSMALGTIDTHYNGRLATIFVTQDMIRSSGAFFDETEGLINYALQLDGVLAAVIGLELTSGVKLSFRSKGDCPINKWAGRFGGGGHANASGAFVQGGQIRRTLKEVVDAAPEHVMADPNDVGDTSDDLTDADLALLAQFNGSL